MSLSKIPFIVASAVGVHCSTISPSQPLSFEEKVVVSSVSESFVRSFLGLCGMEFIKTFAWAVSFAEVAVILATRVDSSQVPGGIYGVRAVQFLRSIHSTPITPAFLVGSLAVAIGGMSRFYCALTLGKFWSFTLSVRKEHRLVTSGPYSVVRHPSYASLLLQYVGIIVMYGSQGSWMRESGILQMPFVEVLAAFYFLLYTAGTSAIFYRIPLEDEMLQHAFGEEWESWVKNVKYRLLPGVY